MSHLSTVLDYLHTKYWLTCCNFQILYQSIIHIMQIRLMQYLAASRITPEVPRDFVRVVGHFEHRLCTCLENEAAVEWCLTISHTVWYALLVNGLKISWVVCCPRSGPHYNDVTMGAMASHITSLTMVYSTIYSGTNQRKHPRQWPLCGEFTDDRWIPPRKGPVTRKMFSCDDVIMCKL